MRQEALGYGTMNGGRGVSIPRYTKVEMLGCTFPVTEHRRVDGNPRPDDDKPHLQTNEQTPRQPRDASVTRASFMDLYSLTFIGRFRKWLLSRMTTSKSLFSMGRIVSTPGALNLLLEHGAASAGSAVPSLPR